MLLSCDRDGFVEPSAEQRRSPDLRDGQVGRWAGLGAGGEVDRCAGAGWQVGRWAGVEAGR